MATSRILIVDDERALVDVLKYNLEKEGFEISTASDGEEGLRIAESTIPDLVLLDLMLPSVDGLQVCRQLRSNAATKSIRILMLTARGEEVDEVVGFNMGADDYVTKPFKIRPLIHRIKALLRRPVVEESQRDVVSTHGIYIDQINHVAKAGDQELALTPTEFELLWTLAKKPGRPFRRHELMDVCRGTDANALERTIDVHIRSLRQKLGDYSDVVETVRGVGYRLRGASSASSASR